MQLQARVDDSTGEDAFDVVDYALGGRREQGADIEVNGRNAFVRGVPRLHGATLVAGDLRGGAALVIAALAAEGTSEVLDLSHIDRGYSDLRGKLKGLGAEIKRVRI